MLINIDLLTLMISYFFVCAHLYLAFHLSFTAFLQQLAFHAHPFTLSQPRRCQMCKSTKVCAGIHCDTCEVDMCRACSRR